MKRGEVWRANLHDPAGSEQEFGRLVVILQDDDFSKSRIRNIVVAAITSNMRLSVVLGNVPLSKKSVAVNRESTINISQIITLEKSLLNVKLGRVSQIKMNDLDEGMQLVLSL